MQKQKHVFVDIRNDEEYEKEHIRGAIHIPIEQLEAKLGRIERYRNEPVVLMCGNGKRSSRATGQLKKMGFANVCSIEGGMKSWIADGMPTESSADEEAAKGKKKGKA